jgi:hypothetical protein
VYNNVTADIFNHKVNSNINNSFYAATPAESIVELRPESSTCQCLLTQWLRSVPVVEVMHN